MSNTITGPPRPVMGENARTRYTAALSVRAGRQHGPLRVATVGTAKATAALAPRYGWTVAPDVDAADALAVALPAGMLGEAADTAVRTALRRGLPILIRIGGDLAAFPDCWAVGVPGGYRLRAPAEPGPPPPRRWPTWGSLQQRRSGRRVRVMAYPRRRRRTPHRRRLRW